MGITIIPISYEIEPKHGTCHGGAWSTLVVMTMMIIVLCISLELLQIA